ncbi:AAA family ATPase [Pseudonocardia sp. KRD-184]|uniref:AAA family ATPase n=1 Tax=Pseudonocardia oceani TaxID=2792013 RepID=A0ABS6UJ43_9PSEU|nr:ATP-binding domain-containing protein [Pseudonocardia oceani]MBW0089097.1 AAA family ATPase [Pseudonocardia oceani]MBW0096010.1 AAA family ATPase [Pseudonocardia oceani]MBW0108623.1 AAA family ATPase [Pseudonocardia oceani]MBW0121867.1 AAA family ATPase [Pseudonocardia oceani]MBW0131936.1 AAA family ATPase [Pseudonocardia oceani]
MLYGRLDARRAETAQRLHDALHDETVGTPQALTERDAAAAMYTDRLAALRAAEHGLAFGRLDVLPEHEGGPGERRYIGRLGLLDEDNDYEPLLMDWRAPAARPFYTATAASPDGIRRRRHLRTRRREVLAVDDEVLDLDAVDAGGRSSGLTSEAALLAAVGARRTGRMGDIVATIQSEQDAIIRSKPSGVLVVQGGPGTGKTAVALHRAAYLLYTHRDRLARRGVLVVGPNPTFLRYIGQVLPSLGETSVVLGTVGQLFPNLDARRPEPAETAEVKGRADMASVIAAAVRDRQQVPRRPVELDVEGQRIRLDRDVANSARTRARRSRKPHNEAKRIFHKEAVRLLAEQAARGLGGAGLNSSRFLDAGDLADIRDELTESRELQRALDDLWPTLSAEQLLTDLFADARRLNSVARRLPAADRARLERPAPAEDVPPGLRWTPADVPLLDEAAELLGDDGAEAAAREAAALREEVLYAQGVLDVLDLEEDLDDELLRAGDIVDAERLAERQAVRRYDSTAERAAADREWTYGHVIVDEAQELSAMAWRLVMRRCPSRSMTLVGDIAQTGDLAGASSWGQVLSPYVANRWRLEQLTVNYRTPSEIADVADDVLAVIEPGLAAPRSVRSTGVPPRAVPVGGDRLDDVVAKVLAEEAGAVPDGRTVVLAPAARVRGLRERLLGAAEPVAGPDTPDGPADPTVDLESPVVVLPIGSAKGLEFDAVVLVEPAEVLEESPRGANDLYVALTRATQRLAVVHARELPAMLHRLDGG